MRIGVDLGNVLTERRTDGLPVFADDRYPLEPFPGAFDAVRRIVALLGPDNVLIVSRCSPEAERWGAAWLAKHGFWEATGVPRTNVRFCRKRHEKAVIAAELRLTHFVDDRWSVLEHFATLPQVTRLYLFRPEPDELTAFSAARSAPALVVDSWAPILDDLLQSWGGSAAIGEPPPRSPW